MVIKAQNLGSLRAPYFFGDKIYFFGDKMDHGHWEDNKPDLDKLTQIPRDAVNWLYVSGYYDGPLTGRVRVAGEELWAAVFEECHEDVESLTDTLEVAYRPACGFYRRYKLIRLTAEADQEEQRRQAIFEEFVGTHTRYDSEGKRHLHELKPEWMWRKFYDQQKTWPTWEPEGELIGWFQN